MARAAVTPGAVVPVRLLNPTGESITLYSGASVAVLSEAVNIVDDHSADTVMVSAVCGDDCAPLEELLMELVKDTTLPSHHQDNYVVGTFG